jgi:hypothetical protein
MNAQPPPQQSVWQPIDVNHVNDKIGPAIVKPFGVASQAIVSADLPVDNGAVTTG